jgi:hypothetical protein
VSSKRKDRHECSSGTRVVRFHLGAETCGGISAYEFRHGMKHVESRGHGWDELQGLRQIHKPLLQANLLINDREGSSMGHERPHERG